MCCAPSPKQGLSILRRTHCSYDFADARLEVREEIARPCGLDVTEAEPGYLILPFL
jgi:hypothetical protein